MAEQPTVVTEGGIGVAASIEGRAITLDPIRSYLAEIPFREVESTIPCGFQVGWIEGGDESTAIDVACGAGMGSEWLTMRVEREGEARYFCVRAGDIVAALMAQIDGEEAEG